MHSTKEVTGNRKQVDLKAGDGVVFDSGNPEAAEPGGTVFAVRPLVSSEGGKGQNITGVPATGGRGGALTAGRDHVPHVESHVVLEIRGDGFCLNQVRVRPQDV